MSHVSVSSAVMSVASQVLFTPRRTSSPPSVPARYLGRRTGLVVASVALLWLASCSTSVPGSSPVPGSTPNASTGTSSSGQRSTTTAPAGKAITWQDCGGGHQCGTLEVPVDHAEPNGETLQLALVRIPATDPSSRIGPLLVNPGGPGGSGIDLAENNLWSPAISRHFDIIGFDPRGVGASTPLECNDTLEQMYSVDPDPRTPAAVAELEKVSKTYVDGCAEKYRDLLPHMGTRDVAADMDDIRVALGVAKISYLGYSYGTSIGQVYADEFPTHIRAMVLDGVVRLGQPGLEAARDQGVAFDDVLESFFAKCRAESPCPFGADPAKSFLAIEAKVRANALPTGDGDRKLTIGEFHLGVGQALYAEFLWPDLVRGLAEAANGDGSEILGLADQYLGRKSDGTYENQSEAYFAVSCLDWSWPSKPQAYLDAGKAVAKTSPYLAEGIVTDYIRCAYWPTPPQPLTPPKAKGSPLIVVVSTTDDPATPYANGVDLAKSLPDAALITKVGSTHTAYGQGSSCVDDAVNAYLVSLRRPPAKLRCN
jgi:pimeloyl-ACP methyl ester carboxylesterase